MREKRFTSRIVFHFWRVTNSIKRYTDRSDRILQFQLLNVLVDGCLSLAFPSCSPRYLPLELNFDIKDDNSNKSTPLTSKTASTTTSTTLAATIPWVAPVFFFPPKMALFEGCKTISDIYLLHWFLQNKVVCRGERPPICFFWSGPWSSIKKQSICVLKKMLLFEYEYSADGDMLFLGVPPIINSYLGSTWKPNSKNNFP